MDQIKKHKANAHKQNVEQITFSEFCKTASSFVKDIDSFEKLIVLLTDPQFLIEIERGTNEELLQKYSLELFKAIGSDFEVLHNKLTNTEGIPEEILHGKIILADNTNSHGRNKSTSVPLEQLFFD